MTKLFQKYIHIVAHEVKHLNFDHCCNTCTHRAGKKNETYHHFCIQSISLPFRLHLKEAVVSSHLCYFRTRFFLHSHTFCGNFFTDSCKAVLIGVQTVYLKIEECRSLPDHAARLVAGKAHTDHMVEADAAAYFPAFWVK